MRCQFCQQDVENPCHTTQDMQQRAAHHVDRCENALRHRHGMTSRSASPDIQVSA